MPRRLISLYLSDDEREQIDARAARAGLTRAEYMRRAALAPDVVRLEKRAIAAEERLAVVRGALRRGKAPPE